jgi:hypothetical protein
MHVCMEEMKKTLVYDTLLLYNAPILRVPRCIMPFYLVYSYTCIKLSYPAMVLPCSTVLPAGELWHRDTQRKRLRYTGGLRPDVWGCSQMQCSSKLSQAAQAEMAPNTVRRIQTVTYHNGRLGVNALLCFPMIPNSTPMSSVIMLVPALQYSFCISTTNILPGSAF